MSFINTIFNKDITVLQNALVNIAKYSNVEMIITDDNLNIIYDNLDRIKNFTKTDLYTFMGSFLNSNIKSNIEKFRKSNKNHLLLKLLLKDSESAHSIPMDFHLCRMRNNQNKTVGYYVIIQDISQEIKNRIQKETFIDIITHDLKTPIRANIQIMELFLENKFGNLNNRQKDILEEILASFRYMNYMADNLLIKYKNEFDIYEPQKQKYSIVKLIKEKCNKLSELLSRKKQVIEFIVKGNIRDIDIDIEEIGKVINNLVVNASEQSGENSKIIVKIENIDDNISVSFIDCGKRETKEKLDKIFDEYVACSNKFRKVGFSLELYNCKKIIEAHNGVISARNANNIGTEITFSLPL